MTDKFLTQPRTDASKRWDGREGLQDSSANAWCLRMPPGPRLRQDSHRAQTFAVWVSLGDPGRRLSVLALPICCSYDIDFNPCAR